METSHKITIAFVGAILGVITALFGLGYPFYSQQLQDNQKEFEIKSGLRTEMIEAISKPISLAQQLESDIRNNTPPVRFSTPNIEVLTEANTALLESKRSIGEKLRTYFPNDTTLLKKWASTVDATYNMAGLSLIDSNTTRKANMNKQILPSLENVLDIKTFLQNDNRLNNNSNATEKLISIISSERKNITDDYPYAWNTLVDLIFRAQQALSNSIMNEKPSIR